jgi:Flp pilus assembly pilin Flp
MFRGLTEFLRSRAGMTAIECVIIAAVLSVGINGGASAIG